MTKEKKLLITVTSVTIDSSSQYRDWLLDQNYFQFNSDQGKFVLCNVNVNVNLFLIGALHVTYLNESYVQQIHCKQ